MTEMAGWVSPKYANMIAYILINGFQINIHNK